MIENLRFYTMENKEISQISFNGDSTYLEFTIGGGTVLRIEKNRITVTEGTDLKEDAKRFIDYCREYVTNG